MRFLRFKNTVRNFKVGIADKIINLLCPFAIRTVFIYTLGAEYLGMNGLFTSILSVLSIANLGIGSAIVYNMYRPIAEDDIDTINSLLLFYRKTYRAIGVFILSAGLLIIPFLGSIAKNGYPDGINYVVAYLVFLLNGCMGYFTYMHWISIIKAYQRNDIVYIINLITQVGLTLCQIATLLLVNNYYIFLVSMPAFTLLKNLMIKHYAKKLYPQHSPSGNIPKNLIGSLKRRVAGLAITKICTVSRNTFDNIFLSIFLGLKYVTIYGNYYIFVSSLSAAFSVFTESVLSGAGNSMVTESKEKNYNDMKKMNFIYMWLSGWASVCLLCLYQNFIKIWLGAEMLLPMSSVILFCFYFYALRMVDIRVLYEDACGIWWENKTYVFIETATNIVLNFFLGKFFEINGIIIATLISIVLINFGYGTVIAYRYCFADKKVSEYFVTHGTYLAVTVATAAITYFACSLFHDTVLDFGLKIVVCIILPNIIMLLTYSRTGIFKDTIPWLFSRLGISKDSWVWRTICGIR